MTRAPHIDYLLVGGGLASATAAETLRLEGAQGTIAIVGAEARLPYHRPPLSGGLARRDAWREPAPVLKDADYRALDVRVLQGVRATAVDTAQRRLTTDTAGTLSWDRLLIATGAAPLRLELPGAELAGIHVLRTADDALAIRTAAEHARRCVVIGASFVGMEVSAALRKRGLRVAIVAGEAGIFGPLRDREVGEFFGALCAANGIEVVERSATRFEGKTSVRGVLLDDGRRLACDFVVVGVGVRPDTDFLRDSGIALDDGVRVDKYLQTNVPGVYAAGDVARFDDPVFGVTRRIEHWDNAVRQGRLAARNMLGERLPYDEVSSFFCQVFDVDFQVIGMIGGAPHRRTLGSPGQRAWARLYLREHVPRAVFTMGRPAQETATLQSLIRYRTNIERIESRIGQPGFVLGDFPSQDVLVLQGGGSLGAFECGVIRALEADGVFPDIVAGVSIGAFNGAIVASHPKHASQALEAFWRDLAVAMPPVGSAPVRQWAGSMQALLFGVPGFFSPRWWPWGTSPADWLAPWTSFYDHAPARRLLEQYVDFDALRTSPVRLLVSAVNVETAQLEIFDSYVHDFAVDHLLASGSLPPGLPWTTIDGRHYWDGGIVSNSPMDQVVQRCGAAGKRVVIVDLFPSKRPLPTNLAEVMMRRDEIVYAERVRRAGAEQALLRDARKLVLGIESQLDPATAARIRALPTYVAVMGAPDAPSIVRIVREATAGEPAGRDFDFSLESIEALMHAGLAAGRRALHAVNGEARSEAPVRGRASRNGRRGSS